LTPVILTPRLLGLMALTGRRQTEIFFSAKFSLPKKKLPYPALIFDGQLKTRHAPGTSFEPYPIPVLAEHGDKPTGLQVLQIVEEFLGERREPEKPFAEQTTFEVKTEMMAEDIRSYYMGRNRKD
jgi:hypothetical protein